MKPYGVYPKDKKLNGKGIKHFFRSQIEDAYRRYCGAWADEDADAEPVEVGKCLEFERLIGVAPSGHPELASARAPRAP